MSEELEPTGLTEIQEKAAMMDAAGESRPTIARACAVTPKTISAWRKSEAYISHRSALRAEITDSLDAKGKEVKLRLLEAGDKAITALVEALDAEREDGTPEYGTRARAAEVLLSKIKFVYDDPAALGQSAGATAAAAIYVNISDTGDVTQSDKPIIEGTATDG